jgi:hypothetical protein
MIAGLVQTIKNSEKTLLVQLDASLRARKEKLLKELQLAVLRKRVNDYYGEIEQISQGAADIFRLDNIDRYIDYVDENNPRSYVNKEGEYLIAEIDSYSKALKKRMNNEIGQVECKCDGKLNDLISNSFWLAG